MSIDPTPLRNALFHSGLKQFEVAEIAGIAESRMSLIARGRVIPTAYERKHIARALRKPVDELFPAQAVAS